MDENQAREKFGIAGTLRCACVCKHVCMHVQTRMCTCMCAGACKHVQTRMHVCASMCVCMCKHVCASACVRVCASMCMHVCARVCMCDGWRVAKGRCFRGHCGQIIMTGSSGRLWALSKRQWMLEALSPVGGVCSA